MTDHLSTRSLLSYVDGELPLRAKRVAARHLSSCWQCRAELERLEHDIGLIVEAHNRILMPSLPPPPRIWTGLDHRLAEADASVVNRLRFYVPLLRALHAGVAVLATGLALCYAALWLFPSRVTAEQVLGSVSAADNARIRPEPHTLVLQRIRITRTARLSTTPTTAALDCWLLSGKVYWRAAGASVAAASLQGHAARARVSNHLPLSPVSYRTWLAEAGGPVRVQQNWESGTVALVATNPASSGLIRQVRLTVGTRGWRVASMELEFPDEQLEVAEEELSVVPRSRAPSDVLASLETHEEEQPSQPREASIGTSALREPLAPEPPDLDEVELGVRLQLLRMQADLGEPVQVDRSGSKVVVKAWDADPERKKQLQTAFENKRDVEVQLTRSAVTDGNFEAPVVAAQSGPSERLPKEKDQTNDKHLTDFFGGFSQREAFTTSALDQSALLESHLYALRNLARRFDHAGAARLTPQARENLELIVSGHLQSSRDALHALRTTLNPLFETFLSGPDTALPPSVDCYWQACTETALSAARKADHALRALLTTTGSQSSLEESLPVIRDQLKLATSALDARASEE